MENMIVENPVTTEPLNLKWTRSPFGIIGGICESAGESLGISPWGLRVGFLISLALGGIGFIAYIALLVSLPRSDRLNEAYRSRVLGVCSRIARNSGQEVGLVRLLAVVLLLISCGTALIAYFIFHFVVDDAPSRRRSMF